VRPTAVSSAWRVSMPPPPPPLAARSPPGGGEQVRKCQCSGGRKKVTPRGRRLVIGCRFCCVGFGFRKARCVAKKQQAFRALRTPRRDTPQGADPPTGTPRGEARPSVHPLRQSQPLPGHYARPGVPRAGRPHLRLLRRHPRCRGAEQGLTLAHFTAQLEDLRDTSLTLELNLSIIGTYPSG